MSTPETHIHGQHHPFNWNRLIAIVLILIFIVLTSLAVMWYQYIQTINGDSSEVQTEGNSSQPSQSAPQTCKEKIIALFQEYGKEMGTDFYETRTGCSENTVSGALIMYKPPYEDDLARD